MKTKKKKGTTTVIDVYLVPDGNGDFYLTTRERIE